MKTTNDIAKKYVHGLHDALTDNQEIIDMSSDIQQYADEYHKAKLKLLNLDFVMQQRELLLDFMDYLENIPEFPENKVLVSNYLEQKQ